MGRKHLYFLSSKIEYSTYLDEDDEFEHVYQYPKEESLKILPNEWGRIKTKSLYIHLLLGNPEQKDCPWCGTEPILKKLPDVECCPMGPQKASRYILQCHLCGSSGPIMNLSESVENDIKKKEYFLDLMYKRYKTRRAWECDIEGLNDE